MTPEIRKLVKEKSDYLCEYCLLALSKFHFTLEDHISYRRTRRNLP